MTTKQLEQVRARIRRGIVWLNKNKKNWRSKINISKLDMSDPNMCMLGFSFHDYWNVVDNTGMSRPEDRKFNLSTRWAVAQGFAAPEYSTSYQQSEYFETLDAEWKRVLRTIKRKR